MEWVLELLRVVLSGSGVDGWEGVGGRGVGGRWEGGGGEG